eukprot:4127533-Amphidinium_carterae.1
MIFQPPKTQCGIGNVRGSPADPPPSLSPSLPRLVAPALVPELTAAQDTAGQTTETPCCCMDIISDDDDDE